jgi:secondary thiamine-phosphate synthase enzyme
MIGRASVRGASSAGFIGAGRHMAVDTYEFTIKTEGFCHIEDVTERIREYVSRSGLKSGIVCVAVVGSTAGVSTIEFEPGLLKDLPEFFESLLPSRARYHHDETWHDGNGFSHLRSFLLKTSHIVPFTDGNLILGTWQQIVVADFDNRPRSRKIVVQILGE